MKKTVCQIICAAALFFQFFADVIFSFTLIPERFCGKIEGFAIVLGIAIVALACIFIFCKVLVIALKGAE